MNKPVALITGALTGIGVMTAHTHQTPPTQYVEANGIRFAYRRFGKSGGVPVVFNQHDLGTMDYWDPAVTDGLARDRELILFNNAGVPSSSGEVPTTFEQMGVNAIFAYGIKERSSHVRRRLQRMSVDAIFEIL